MASIHDEEAKDGGNVHQVDRDAVQQNLEQAIGEAADKREAALTSLYPVCDEVRTSHPEFAVYQDGPYHVVGVEVAPAGTFVNVVYYRPYPLFIDVCPYGWAWGRPYPFVSFGVQVRLFHSTWLTIGCPVFEPMFYGGVGFYVVAPIRQSVIINRSRWDGGRPPAITENQRRILASHQTLQQSKGAFKPRQGFVTSTRAIPAIAARSSGSSFGNRGGASTGSKYNRTGTTGSTRSGQTGTTGASKYSHSAVGSSSRTGAGSGASAGGSRDTTRGSTATGSGSGSVSKYSRSGSTSTGTSTSGSRDTSRGSASSGGSTSTGSRYSHGTSTSTSGSTSGKASSGTHTGSTGSSSSSKGSSGSSSDEKKKSGG